MSEAFRTDDVAKQRLNEVSSVEPTTLESHRYAHAQERARCSTDAAKYCANGILPGDFQITNELAPNAGGSRYKLYERPALHPVEPMPPVSDILTAAPYNSAIKLNVQVTNGIDVSPALTPG